MRTTASLERARTTSTGLPIGLYVCINQDPTRHSVIHRLAVLEAKVPAEGFINGLSFPTVADLAIYILCTGYMPFGASYKLASYDVSKFTKVTALAARTTEHSFLKDSESATQSAAAFGL